MVDIQSTSGCLSNCTTRMGFFGQDDLWEPWEALTNYFEYQPWFFSLMGSAMVGLSGVLPLYIIPIDEAADLKNGDSAKTLQILLSFAVGGLLGDVFLHLLPEAWANNALLDAEKRNINDKSVHHPSLNCGLWVLCGFLVFVIAEKMFCSANNEENENEENENEKQRNMSKDSNKERENNNCNGSLKIEEFPKFTQNGYNNVNGTKLNGFKKLSNGITHKNGYVNGFSNKNGYCELRDSIKINDEKVYKEKNNQNERTRERPKQISGYLNLMANCVDNFTHGLAVGGSFLISFRLGALTTFAILVHEIPHEIGDFAILLKSGFSRWEAAKAQLMTATGGICGAFIAVVFSGDAVESKTSWILPFTAGGFLHIGLVNVLPELVKETDPKESIKQIGALLTGIVVMAFLTLICE